jgi:hypothetical protein
MTSRFVLVIALVACGGSKPQPSAPAPQEAAKPVPVAPVAPAEEPPVQALKAEPQPAPAPAAPPAPAKAPAKSLYERLRDTDGKVPGLAGFSIKRKADAKRCGGFAIVTKRAKKVAKADALLAAVYKLEFPTGLSFDPDPQQTAKREASMLKFNKFLEEMTAVGTDARKHYEKQLAEGDATTKVAAAARMAQVYLRLASLLGRAEIPADVRSGDFADDKIEVFCDTLVEKAEPIQALGEQAMSFCAEKAKAVAPGWWNEICVTP